MKRLPINHVVSSVVGNMKNNYRAPPNTTTLVGAPAPAASAVFEPAPTYQPQPHPPPASHQRFLYANSSTLPPAINYTNQLQIYVSILRAKFALAISTMLFYIRIFPRSQALQQQPFSH
jgi:hypothetical protein